MTCLVLWCKNKGKIPGINYFCLTKKRHDSWLRALGRDPNAEHLSEKNVICSKHFSPRDVYFKGSRMYLKPNSVPSFFLRKNNNGVSTQERTRQELHSKPVQNTDSPIIELDDLEVLFVENKENSGLSLHVSSTPTIEIEESVSTSSLDSCRSFKRSLEDTSTDSEGNRGEIKRTRREIKTRHNYSTSYSILLRKLKQANIDKSLEQKKVRALKVQVDRLKKRVANLKQILKSLKKEEFISQNSILQKSLTVVPLSLMKRTTEVNNKEFLGKKPKISSMMT